ncbi:MAG: hypothetical protein R3E58_11490 [Phycisphaerae bacterium]
MVIGTGSRWKETRLTAGTSRVFQAVTLDQQQLAAVLDNVPSRSEVSVRDAQSIIELPMPDGSYAFSVVESPVMAPELAARYRDSHVLRSGHRRSKRSGAFRLNAGWLSCADSQSEWPSSTSDPINRGDTLNYASYYKRDLARPEAAPKVSGLSQSGRRSGRRCI